MPIYEYRCSQCQSTFARLQRVGTPVDAVQCPECGSGEVGRILSVFASSSPSRSPSSAGTTGCGGGGFT